MATTVQAEADMTTERPGLRDLYQGSLDLHCFRVRTLMWISEGDNT